MTEKTKVRFLKFLQIERGGIIGKMSRNEDGREGHTNVRLLRLTTGLGTRHRFLWVFKRSLVYHNPLKRKISDMLSEPESSDQHIIWMTHLKSIHTS